MFLLVVVVVAALGGFVPAFVCAITGFLLANWYFTPPYYEFTISEGENLFALVIFLLVAGVVSLLVATASRRTAEAAQARAEAETLAALSGTLSASDDPLPQLVSQLRLAFEADARRRARPAGGDDWQVAGECGRRRRSSDPTTPTWSVPLARRRRAGPAAPDLRRRRPRGAPRRSPGRWRSRSQQRELRADADRAAGLAEANELRTALLAAVSHDLRTPLSSIKASVSEPAAARRRLHARPPPGSSSRPIDEGADRLNHLIGNLLDMSRLQTGAVQLVMRDVGLDEVAARSRSPASPRPTGSRSTSTRRCRACAPTPRCSSARSPTWSRTPSRGRRPTAHGARRSVRRAAAGRPPRGRPRPGHPAVAARGRLPPVPATGRPLQRQRSRARARRGARLRRGDGRRASWSRTHPAAASPW